MGEEATKTATSELARNCSDQATAPFPIYNSSKPVKKAGNIFFSPHSRSPLKKHQQSMIIPAKQNLKVPITVTGMVCIAILIKKNVDPQTI